MLSSSLQRPDWVPKLTLPPGAKFKISYWSNTIGQNLNVPLSVSPHPNHYLAIFPEDDVNFEISVDNSTSTDRSLCVDIEIHNQLHSYVVPSKSVGRLEALVSNGPKLHFVRQGSLEGEALMSTAAAMRRLTFDAASLIISQIRIWPKYSKQESSTVRDSTAVFGGNRNLDRYSDKRGAICFAEASNQTFEMTQFDHDPSIDIKPFVIELRMASRYSLVQ